MLQNPNILINQSIQSAAIDLDVSTTAIMRIVKKLGYRGLAELKLALEEISEPTENKVTHKKIISNIISDYQLTLNVMEEILNESQIKKVVKWLLASDQIKILGLGSSGLAAEQFVYSLLYQDEYVESITSRTKIYYLARALSSKMLLIVYSVSGNLEFYEELFENAKLKKAKIVLITMNQSDELKNLVDELVLLPSNYTDFSKKDGLRQLDNRYSFFVFSEILAAYYEENK